MPYPASGRMSPIHDKTDRISREELRAAFSLSSLFALRMLGLFIILPVFAVHARHNLPGGENQTLISRELSSTP